MTSIKFLKGSRDEFAKPNDESFEERAEIIRRHLAEVFGSESVLPDRVRLFFFQTRRE